MAEAGYPIHLGAESFILQRLCASLQSPDCQKEKHAHKQRELQLGFDHKMCLVYITRIIYFNQLFFISANSCNLKTSGRAGAVGIHARNTAGRSQVLGGKRKSRFLENLEGIFEVLPRSSR